MSDTNSSGIWGFIFSLLAYCFGWLPYVGGIFWILGAILSCVGLASRPRGFALAGFIVSFFWLLLWLILGFTVSTFAAFTLWPYFLW